MGEMFCPPRLLKELQKYIDGELIYVPKCAEQRAGWGEINGTKDMIDRRNHDIYQQYTSGGCSIMELIRTHHLSEDSIRKIILKTRNDLRQTVAT